MEQPSFKLSGPRPDAALSWPQPALSPEHEYYLRMQALDGLGGRLPPPSGFFPAANAGFGTREQREPNLDVNGNDAIAFAEGMADRMRHVRENPAAGHTLGFLRGAGEWLPGLQKLGAAADALHSGRTYAQELARSRGAEEADREVQPMTRLAGQAAGFVGTTVAMPGLNVMKGAGIAANAVNAGVTGAAYGGLSGFIDDDGNLVDKLAASGRGAAFGAAVGAPLGATAGWLGHYLRSARASRSSAGALPPEAGAGEMIVERSGNRSAYLHNPPDKPPRPFSDDYPNGATTFPDGRLRFDIDRNPLHARYIVGRQVAGGPDVPLPVRPLPNGATDDMARSFTGQGIKRVPRDLIGSDGISRFLGRRRKPLSVEVADDLAPAQEEMVRAHEIAHVIDELAAEIPIEGLEDELATIYNVTQTGDEARIPLYRPEDRGYPAEEVRSELMAEAIRANLANPNYIKTVAPNTAARIRLFANRHPIISKIVQFNSLTPLLPLAGGALALTENRRSPAGALAAPSLPPIGNAWNPGAL